ncbi:MAG: pyridoxal phosphate-dependent aminotransferase, partial [Desulfobacterales bacterium]|nr:pyridoxal phosphate-dependent aminotransferase [Desulfobacterales bacterium]
MIAKRAAEMTSFIVMDVLEKAHEMERQGTDVIHLEVGEPDFDTPKCIIDAAEKGLKDGYTHYTHSLGIIELRETICEYYANTYRVTIDPDQIIVTSGTSPAMFMLFSAILEENDEVIISDPHYACYPNFIKFLKGVPVTVPVYEDDGFQYRTASIQEKISAKTKGIFINSPSNPTGNLLSTDRMQKIAELSPYIISDEIYHGLVYGEKAHSILEFTDRAFIFNGFSKLYAMTGFRLGYVIAPKEFIRPMQKIQQNFFISANAMVQMAGIAALKHAQDDVSAMKDIYDQRRQYMIKRLREIGFGITVEPTGAFYVFANA